MIDKKIYEKVIESNGHLLQKNKTMEELRELHYEIKQEVLFDKYNRINMIGEIADVYNMLEQLKIIYDISDVTIENEMLRKRNRTLREIEFNKTVEG